MADQRSSSSPLIFQQDIAPGSITQRALFAFSANKGDLYIGLDGTHLTNIAIGKTGQVLTVVNGMPAWAYLMLTGTAANRPTTGQFTGQMYSATDTFALSIWFGAAWKSITLS